MNTEDCLRMVNRSARLYTIIRSSVDREEGIEALHKAIEKVGLLVSRKVVQRVYDRARTELQAA